MSALFDFLKSFFPDEKTADPAKDDSQLKFLLAAITDQQSVIRAIDTKITALSFGLAVPLTRLSDIWRVCRESLEGVNGIAHMGVVALILIFAACWAVSILAALRTLFHVDNPAQHISGDRPSGILYSPTLFRVGVRDVFFPRRLDAASQFPEFMRALPTSQNEVCRELAFELMKVVYIRTIKFKRASVTYLAFTGWLAAGAAIWILALALRSNHGSYSFGF